jgi:hypothetical protein
MHYPECWDTSAYPTVLSALIESSQGCTDCNPSAQIPAELVAFINTFPELNMSNYSDDDIAELNVWGIKLVYFVKSQLEKNER